VKIFYPQDYDKCTDCDQPAGHKCLDQRFKGNSLKYKTYPHIARKTKK